MFTCVDAPARISSVCRYGFDFGCIHVVMMSTEHDYRNTSKQYQFLDNHFKSINRTKTPWLIFSGHRCVMAASVFSMFAYDWCCFCRPMYIDSTNITEPSGEMPVSRLLRAHIEPLLKVA